MVPGVCRLYIWPEHSLGLQDDEVVVVFTVVEDFIVVVVPGHLPHTEQASGQQSPP